MENNVGYNIDIFADAHQQKTKKQKQKTAEQTRTVRFKPLYQSA